LFELVEDGAAMMRLAPWQVWLWALDAIQAGTLPIKALYDRGLSLPVPGDQAISSGKSSAIQKAWWGVMIGDARLVRRSKQVPSHFGHRYSSVVIDTSVFQRLLKYFPVGVLGTLPRLPVGRKPDLRQKVRKFMDERWPDGILPKIVEIQIALKQETGLTASEATIRRARDLR
jgi:hypothetical protein